MTEILIPRPRLRLAIFDLDGTLVEYENEWLAGEVVRLFGELGYPPITREEAFQRISSHSLFSFLSGHERTEAEAHFWQQFNHDAIPVPRPYVGAVEALAETRERGLEIAVATARWMGADELKELLSCSGLCDHVSVFSTWAERKDWRDKREQLGNLCSQMGVASDAACMIGDTPGDIRSANAVGLAYSVALLSGGITREVLEAEGPSVIVDHVGHVPRVIDEYHG